MAHFQSMLMATGRKRIGRNLTSMVKKPLWNSNAQSIRKNLVIIPNMCNQMLTLNNNSEDDQSNTNKNTNDTNSSNTLFSFIPNKNITQKNIFSHPCSSLRLQLNNPIWKQQSPQRRNMSVLPEMFQNFSIWGGSGYVLKTIHMNGTIPYWACISITNITIRTALLPLVVQGAKTSIKFASVAPEIQFLMTLFQKEMITLKEGGASAEHRRKHVLMNLSTVRRIYKIHGIHPFAVFKVCVPNV